jgi:nucleoid-associated protein YgaU
MGKVEKLVVLSVLFLVALILVVSITMDDPQVAAGGGVSAEERQIAMVPNDAPAGAAAGAAFVAPPIDSTPPRASTLSAVVETAPVAQASAQLAPAGSILVTLEGLEDSVLPDFKLYTWREGDSFRLLANMYYGDWKKLTLLRQANAGNEDVKAGDRIYVPVYDNPNLPQPEGAGTLADEPADAKPASEKAPAAAKAAVAKQSEPKAAAAKSSAAGRVHVVKSGESLWIIAKKELGDGSRWKEIQELNGLKKPEAIKIGMKLKLP